MRTKTEELELKKFNINDYIYIQITDEGWRYLKKTVGDDYIKHCINAPSHKKTINGETWYRLQCHSVFDILPINFGGRSFFNTNIMFDENSLK